MSGLLAVGVAGRIYIVSKISFPFHPCIIHPLVYKSGLVIAREGEKCGHLLHNSETSGVPCRGGGRSWLHRGINNDSTLYTST